MTHTLLYVLVPKTLVGFKLLRFASFCSFTLAVAESQAGEIKPCVSFLRGETFTDVCWSTKTAKV